MAHIEELAGVAGHSYFVTDTHGGWTSSAEDEDALGGGRIGVYIGIFFLDKEPAQLARALCLVITDNDCLHGKWSGTRDGTTAALDIMDQSNRWPLSLSAIVIFWLVAPSVIPADGLLIVSVAVSAPSTSASSTTVKLTAPLVWPLGMVIVVLLSASSPAVMPAAHAEAHRLVSLTALLAVAVTVTTVAACLGGAIGADGEVDAGGGGAGAISCVAAQAAEGVLRKGLRLRWRR